MTSKAASETESVWDYPRPPALVRSERRVRVVFCGRTIADSTRILRVLETASPPTVYVPREDIVPDCLESTTKHTMCEWKGAASYYDVVVAERRAKHAAWWYPHPAARFSALRDHIAFYPGRVACYLDDERVRPQPGEFYGGWVTSDIVGPFKGEPGTLGW
jgi:uncharacterized protein (DUF427 family)